LVMVNYLSSVWDSTPDVYEHFHGIYSVKFFSATLYVVGCPASPYCNEFQIDPSIIYTPTTEDFGYTHRHQWIRSNLTAEIAMRIKPQYPQEEFALTNFIYYGQLITTLDMQGD
ncbi:unnamed protein product, partial [Meganyctiphanes norvegica]